MRERLAAHGLDKLTQDLADREVEDAAIDNELDLAWWASLLRAMLASPAPPSAGLTPPPSRT